jgi:signal transduction histidine kinase
MSQQKPPHEEDRASLERRLREALLEAQRANESKSQFLAMISHELRTPLNAIIGYSEILSENLQDQEHIEDIGKIHGAGRHLLALIDNLLDISKVEAGAMELNLSWFEVSELLNDVAAMVLPRIAEDGNLLVVHVEPEIGKMYGDPMRLRQVLLNLLSNAAKFTDDGLVRLHASGVEHEGRECVHFSVKDTGIGMSDKHLSKIFEPFAQADSSIANRYGGTGLGLTLTKRFVEMMEGTIDVESALGSGSTFSIVLPINSAPPNKTAASA